GNLVADEFGGDEIGDAGAVAFAVADIVGEAGAAEILALGDIFHLGGDDAFAGIVHLADVLARPGAQRALHDIGELRDAARTVGAELAVILGADFAGVVALDVAARLDPLAAQVREAGLDVDPGIGVGVGAGRVVDAQRGLAAGRLEIDLAHRH